MFKTSDLLQTINTIVRSLKHYEKRKLSIRDMLANYQKGSAMIKLKQGRYKSTVPPTETPS